MNIELENIGKKFRNEWIFKKLDFKFESGKKYAITGHNGSGKSTLLQVISGLIPANLGKVKYLNGSESIEPDEVYKFLSFTAPYIELIEEYSLKEALDFHIKFKPLKAGLSKIDFFKAVFLEEHLDKPIKQFSSGMKQRLKLGLSFLTEAEVILLDEPTTNLDEFGINWYLKMVSNLETSKLLIISSNDKREYQFCNKIVDITEYKG